MPAPPTATSRETRAGDGTPEDGVAKMKSSRKHLLTAAVSLPLALTLLTACGDSKGTIETIGPAGPAGVSSTAPTTTPPTSSPKATVTPAPKPTTVANRSTPSETNAAKPSTSRGVLSGTRKVSIVPVPSFESGLALDSSGRLGLTDAEGTLFVFTPTGRQFLITTAEVDAKTGEPSCLRIKSNGSQSLTVVAALCDASNDRQLFDVAADGKNYVISNASAYLQVNSDGFLIAEELGDAPLETSFKLVDNGKASVPTD
jgi:hypothetical protein